MFSSIWSRQWDERPHASRNTLYPARTQTWKKSRLTYVENLIEQDWYLSHDMHGSLTQSDTSVISVRKRTGTADDDDDGGVWQQKDTPQRGCSMKCNSERESLCETGERLRGRVLQYRHFYIHPMYVCSLRIGLVRMYFQYWASKQRKAKKAIPRRDKGNTQTADSRQQTADSRQQTPIIASLR